MKKLWSVLALCLLLTGCSRTAAPELRQQVGASFDTATVERGDVGLKAVYLASVSQEFVPVETEQSALVDRVLVHPGDRVAEGDLLMELGTARLTEQREQRKAARDALEKSSNDQIHLLELDLAAALEEQKAGDSEMLRLQIRELDAQLRCKKGILEERLVQADRQLARLDRAIEGSRICAPCDGEIASLNVKTGSYAKAGELLRIARSGSDYLLCTEASSALAYTPYRCEAQLGGETYPLELIPYSAEELMEARMKGAVPARFRLPEEAEAKPGDAAQLTVYLREEENALYLPRTAVYDRLGLNAGYVYCLVDGEKVYREVTVAFFTEALAVIASGLEEGDVVYVPQSA